MPRNNNKILTPTSFFLQKNTGIIELQISALSPTISKKSLIIKLRVYHLLSKVRVYDITIGGEDEEREREM